MDLIDRQDVLYQLTTCKTYYNTTYRNATVSKSEITAMINKLPFAEPERKTGRWIQHPIYEGSDHYYYACSECDYRSWSKDNFCSVCGAKMKEEEVSNGSD